MSLVTSSTGQVQASHLAESLLQQTGRKISIHPERVRIFNLAEILKRQFNLNSMMNFRQLNFLDRTPLLLSDEESMDFECSACENTGEKTIKITLRNPLEGNHSSRFLKARVMTNTKALVAHQNLRVSNQAVEVAQFKTENIETDKPELLFQDGQTLNFYRLNRPLNAGEALKFSDLTPAPLIQPGTQAQVILQNQGFTLKTVANPLKSARFGETVQLRHPKTQKMIIGKVIDYNKVEVTQ